MPVGRGGLQRRIPINAIKFISLEIMLYRTFIIACEKSFFRFRNKYCHWRWRRCASPHVVHTPVLASVLRQRRVTGTNWVLTVFKFRNEYCHWCWRRCASPHIVDVHIATNGGSANPATRLSFLMTAFYVGSANLAIRLSCKMNATRPTHFRWPS